MDSGEEGRGGEKDVKNGMNRMEASSPTQLHERNGVDI